MRYVWLALLSAGWTCGDNYQVPDAPGHDGRLADAVPSDGATLEPPTLAGTGLCIDLACTQISPEVLAYTPNAALWADTASKRRWLYLPPGTKIDTTDMDHWQFPVGTKIWKEFTRGGTRVETRYIARVGAGNTFNDWFYVAYAWNQTQDGTTAVPLGVQNALGTGHDIPARSACRGCHERLAPTRVLGVGAIQLDHPAATGEVALGELIAQNLLTAPPTGAAPYFPIPGTATEQAALGYLHANCGHCHNPSSDVFTSTGITMVLRLEVGKLATPAATPTYSSSIGVDAQHPRNGLTKIIVARSPAQSGLVYRFEATNLADHMPALGSSMMDPTGDSILRAWITALP